MTYYFFDSSALVKNYCDEPGSRWVRRTVAEAQRDPSACAIVVCDLVLPECASAFVRKARSGQSELSVDDANLLISRLAEDVVGEPSIFVVVEGSGLMGDAASCTQQHGLTGADAVHLACAIASRASIPMGYDCVFATADVELARAARVEGFEVIEQLLPTRARV